MAPKKQKDKWRKAFDKRERNLEDSKAPGEPSKQNQDAKETPSPGREGSQGACGTSADEKPGGKRQGRFAKKQMEAKMHSRYQGRKEAGPDLNETRRRTQGNTGAGSGIPKAKGEGGTSGDKQPSTRNGQGDNLKKSDQTRKTRGRGVSAIRWNSQGPSLNGREKPLDNKNQSQRPGRPNPTQQNKGTFSPGVFPGTSNSLNLKMLKEKNGAEVAQKLSESIVQLRFLLRSQEEHYNSDEFIFDLTCTLAIVCRGPSGENANKILAALKGSAFLSTKIPRLLNRIQASLALKDHDSRQTLFQCLIVVFTRYLTHLPSSYVDLPYVQVKLALEQSDIDMKEELQRELDAFKQTRDDIIRAERQKYGKRYRAGQKPPNDFRDIPICPTNKEITTQEQPFLRGSISKGRYENAEHYLDVQFRLLREDFVEPLREGIKEIVQNVPKQQRKQLMTNYRRVWIFNKEFTWSGIIHHVKIDVSGLNTSRWAHSKRLMFGSFLCLSNDNFKTMLFATVSNRDPEELKRGRIDIRFIEEQDVLGIENRNCVYQMVESPAYFEAYRHVLKGLKELDEGTLPFQKYIVECSGDVDPPEYLRGNDSKEGPICYDLSKALDVTNTMCKAVPVLLLEAWPSVEDVPLNNSQLEALQTAITTEFSVIQGPPGTGKTYVGAKIVKCLLENRAAWDPQCNTPMLMVCYTNHALDQFLEKVLEFLSEEEIIRVGGRCKSQRLEGCNLKKFTYQYKQHQERHNVREKMIKNDRDLKQCKNHLAEADKQLLELRDLEPLMSSEHADQLYRTIFPYNATNTCRTPANAFRLWLCDHKEVNRCNQNTITETEDENESQPDGMVFDEFGTNGDEGECHDAAVLLSVQFDENKNESPRLPTRDALVATNNVLFNDPCNTEEDEKRLNLRKCPLLDVTTVNPEAENSDPAISKMPAFSTEADSIVQNEEPKTEDEHIHKIGDEVIDGCEETIVVEREVDLIQHQRYIEGDEDLLMAVSEQANDFTSQVQDQAGRNEETGKGFTEVSYRKKGKANQKAWFETEGNNSRRNKQTKTKPSEENTNKNKALKDLIINDIQSLRKDLRKETMMSTDEAIGVTNIWSLTQSDRFRLYLFWVENYRDRYRLEIYRSEQEYEQLCQELQTVKFQEDEQVIRQATVVGMTTSGAARYHSVLQRVAPRIIVIEEAAEVMEAHIITSLSHNTKHTILIGDHKQLRPKATVYELAQKYNLEVSLFERMVRNNMKCQRLSIQHRMRPEIAALTKRIYDHEIIDHESVCHFEDISGVCHNVFFINHCQREESVDGMQSFSNPHEAMFVIALCKYLELQGYQRNNITILTMYTGQLLLLQRQMPREKFEGVRVCVVDNFQGEENDIILLSLVRSNSEGRIGFLAESNRICVALSRARKGLYCIGNFNLLKSQSKLWEDICDDLKEKSAIAETLQLVCKRHANVTNVKTASDFNPLGGCSMPCETRLPCGHACEKSCHVSSHVENKCLKACPNRCANNHPCPRKCHFPRKCSICRSTMSKKVPKCGHEQKIPCSVDPKDFSCLVKCEKMLPCKHICSNKCGQVCTSKCKVSCMKYLRCGHQKTLPCYKDPMDYIHCEKKCTKILECGHLCSMKCKEKCQCDDKIDVQLQCEHRKRVLCREKGNPIQCNEKCKRQLSCGHTCPGMCYEECKLKKCHIVVVKDLPCGHQESIPCYQDPKTAFCFAPCPRQLGCGHRCSSVCGRLCHEVKCEELCQRKCDRGHSCQRRCHFGSICGNCMAEVNMVIPRCGHSIKLPCYIDPATQKCKQPCQRQRVCGHPCGEICSKNCESKPCKVHVTTTLPCNHVVSLECHRNPQKFICKKEVEVSLPCGHKTTLKCHVAKAGLESVLCNTPVEKDLGCYHKITLPCFKNPKECVCRKKVNVELACGHMKSLHCSTATAGITDILCMVKVRRALPCNHEAILPCHRRPEEHYCDEEVESTLSCGHIKRIACSSVRDRLQGGTTNVMRELSYSHEKEIQCSDNPEKVYCDAPCQRFLPCGHPCPKKCGDNCDDFKCIVRIEKELSCGYHKISCLCSEDVSQVICSNRCKRYFTCGHQCPGKCYEDCRQHKCLRIVVKNLHCEGNHSLKMPCSTDPLTVACQAPCNRKLECGHPCTGLCNQLCKSITCRRGVEKKYPCGHKEQLQCFQSKTATCKAPCRRRERCKHMCKGICGEPCSNYPCDVLVGRTLSCGHKVQMPCSSSVDDVQCPAPCGATLPCGHTCSGTCNDCKQRGSHEMCQQPCSRILVCLHRCKAICSEPCPPCDRKCSRLCPHTKCTEKCSQLCAPCTKSCTWSCPHYQCNNLCGEACERPPCNAPCPKKLACRHPCIGLCGENCPTLCSICHAKKVSSILAERGRKASKATRYLQLFDCGHILAVEEMDAWMIRKVNSNAQLIRCPRCSTAITFSYRYEKLVKVTLSNVDSVKKQVEEIAKESFKLASNLLRNSHRLCIDLRLMKFPRSFSSIARIPYITALDSVEARNIPLVSTLKNHLIVLRQVEKAEGNLPTVEKHQENSEDQRELKQQSDTIREALEKIRDYLMKPQLDLRTLHQVHEDTRKLALLASVLKAQSEAINQQTPFSSISQTDLKLARKGFKMFLEGNNDALKVSWLEETADSLRKEVGLPPLSKEEPKEFENFPAFSKDEWKICEHRQVYSTRRIVRDGEDITIRKSSCTQCDEGQCE